MHSGAYFTSGLGAAQCSRPVGTREWQSSANTTAPDYDPATDHGGNLRRGLEFHADLHQWNDRQPEWGQLCGQLLDAKSNSFVQQRGRRKRTALDGHRNLHHRCSTSASATSPTAASSGSADLRSLYRHESHRG